jgi:hypothetical protein
LTTSVPDGGFFVFFTPLALAVLAEERRRTVVRDRLRVTGVQPVADRAPTNVVAWGFRPPACSSFSE